MPLKDYASRQDLVLARAYFCRSCDEVQSDSKQDIDVHEPVCPQLVDTDFNLHLEIIFGFQCYAQDCPIWHATRTERDIHCREQHFPTEVFLCREDGCAMQVGTRLDEVQLHYRSVHEVGLFECGWIGCEVTGPHRGTVSAHARDCAFQFGGFEAQQLAQHH